jgi:hypothetical protein
VVAVVVVYSPVSVARVVCSLVILAKGALLEAAAASQPTIPPLVLVVALVELAAQGTQVVLMA